MTEIYLNVYKIWSNKFGLYKFAQRTIIPKTNFFGFDENGYFIEKHIP